MAKTKRKQTTKTQQPGKSSISKMEAVRQALTEHGPDIMPSQILEFVKTKFGMTMSPAMVSNYKSTLSKKMAGKSAVVRRPRGERSSTSSQRLQATISLDDLSALKRLVDRLGADRIKELTRVLGD